ncbi:MAG: alpha/beta hydrolase [Armatimonadota bacterium]|nr:alpha/beta hydrolase [Armatimonadota bacterium]MDR7400903.1 alpha/beta hydrolase [Armatimonadota bacterium]MDR7404190.1 alpha/beta hydrolase [Armatimonadota bacterium]MDR7437379.1 alpha/beta hydrolase [Armatimonadota bacterium]MDR7472805.1 alpha/beta hydrolase [Armatimonadota bacterium]
MPRAIAAGSVSIDYVDSGSGEPALLLLPGWCSSRRVFERLLPRVSSTRRTVSLDWRAHGGSELPQGDFGSEALVEDALAVIGASGARRVVPVAQAHASWIALELRRRLGDRVPKLVLLDWLILDPPPPFLAVLEALQDRDRWEQARAGLFAMWLEHVDDPVVTRFVKEDMGSYGYEWWARAGREITRAYAEAGSGLRALRALDPPVPTLHLYAQPPHPEFLAAQRAFAVENPWFRVERLSTNSHFPSLEAPERVAEAIERFVGDG